METMNDDTKNDMKDNQYDFGKGAGPDFGTDSGDVPESDPQFDAWVAKVAPTLNVPNAAPRNEMWDAIRATRQTASDAQAGKISGVTPLRRSRWPLMSVIAAALLLGVAIDRLALRQVDDPNASGASAAKGRGVASLPAAPKDSNDPSRLYRMAAAQTLTQAEALLTAYRASGVAERNPAASRQLGSWGREVLSSTRLLLDSPAGDDPQLRPLLDDLELVLVQIIQVSGAIEAGDRALIDRALQERNLLPRIRTAVPANIAGAASSE
jgi:hypothetical protein